MMKRLLPVLLSGAILVALGSVPLPADQGSEPPNPAGAN